MRADLAPFGVDAMLAIAGFGVLVAAGLVPRSAPSILGALGLAYLTGAAVVPIALTLLLVAGIPFSLVTFGLVVMVCVGVGVVRWQSWTRTPTESSGRLTLRSWRTWHPDTWALLAFCLIFGVFWGIGMLSALDMPLSSWDAWSIWARKAEVLTAHDSLLNGFFTNPNYEFAHLDYPLQLPIWEALHFRAAGNFETQLLLRHVWLLLGAFAWSLAYLLHGRMRPLVWAPIVLLVVSAPGVWQQLLSGYADVPMAMFACVGAVSLGLWLRGDATGLLAIAAATLAAAANMKNEGLVTAVAILVVAGAIVLANRHHIRPFLVAAAIVVASVLPWRIWVAAHGIEGDLPVFKGLDPRYLLDRFERVRPTVEAINAQLADQSRWLYLLPLAALLVTASLVSGRGRRAALLYLGSFALTWAAFVWSYWISPNDLSWHLSTSVDRVVSAPMFICFAAVLHLSGILAYAWLPLRRS